MKLFPSRSKTKNQQLVFNEVETPVRRLSFYDAAPIDFASASAAEEEEEEKKDEENDEVWERKKVRANCFYIIANY